MHVLFQLQGETPTFGEQGDKATYSSTAYNKANDDQDDVMCMILAGVFAGTCALSLLLCACIVYCIVRARSRGAKFSKGTKEVHTVNQGAIDSTCSHSHSNVSVARKAENNRKPEAPAERTRCMHEKHVRVPDSLSVTLSMHARGHMHGQYMNSMGDSPKIFGAAGS